MSGFPTTTPPQDPMPPLMTDAELKALLGITGSEYDAQVTFSNEVVSSLIRGETGQFLTRGEYQDRFIPRHNPHGFFSLNQMPLWDVISVSKGGTDVGFRWDHGAMSMIWVESISADQDDVVVTYEAGYDPIPGDLKGAMLDLVRRQLTGMGVTLTASGADAPTKAVTVGSLRVDYAVGSAAAVASGSNPLLRSVLAQYEDVFARYGSTRKFAATP